MISPVTKAIGCLAAAFFLYAISVSLFGAFGSSIEMMTGAERVMVGGTFLGGLWFLLHAVKFGGRK